MHVVQGSILRKAKSSSPLAIVWIVATLLAPLSARADTVTAVSDALRDILGSGQPPVIDIEAAIGAHQLAGLQAVYAARHDRPIWFDQDGIAAPATALLGRLSGSGLTLGPQVQPLLQDAQARAAAANPHIRAELDLILSALYGVTAGALQHATAPVDFAAALTSFTQAKDQMALVQEAPPPSPPPSPSVAATQPPAAQGQTPPQTATTEAQPANAVPAAAISDLARVGAALDAYRKRSAAGGWPMIPDGPKLQLGDTGPRVDALRARLSATGDLATGVASAAYDAPLVGALQHFQMRHGLKPDGIVGPQTLVTLNVPIDQRIAALAALQQKVKARDWGQHYLVVNLAGADYRFVDAGRVAQAGAALVGDKGAPTPMLDGMIAALELHPAWMIPQRYADRMLWPKQDADANYFTSHGIHVTDDGLRQDPGPGNPLGAVKFLFDNPAGIALTDSNDAGAFAQPDRFTGSGCVALAGAKDLAKLLLAADPQWPEDKIDAALQPGATQTVPLATPLPVHLVYDTAWIDDDGTVEFRDDIYGWDAAPPPAPAPLANPNASPCAG
jgi:murein L,D-transpeptidase YcbB/YkuD